VFASFVEVVSKGNKQQQKRKKSYNAQLQFKEEENTTRERRRKEEEEEDNEKERKRKRRRKNEEGEKVKKIPKVAVEKIELQQPSSFLPNLQGLSKSVGLCASSEARDKKG
jgi:sortase (surface protein transpeptidase)